MSVVVSCLNHICSVGLQLNIVFQFGVSFQPLFSLLLFCSVIYYCARVFSSFPHCCLWSGLDSGAALDQWNACKFIALVSNISMINIPHHWEMGIT